MANSNMEINVIVKTCKILLLDIEGTTTSISFVKDKLFPYAEENVKRFLESEWDKESVKETVTALRKLAIEDGDNGVEGLVPIPGEDAPKEEQIEGLVNNVKWQMSSDRKAGPLKLLQGLIWKQGYDNGDIKGHVYDDVASALEQWHSVEGQKVYIYSSGSVQAQKLLFGQSSAGNLLVHIDGHFDTAIGAKQEAASYKAIAEKIDCKPEDILFLTDIEKEAEAAAEAGLRAALVSRAGNAALAAAPRFPVLRGLAQLATNKRKPQDDTQEEQPAKIAKTTTEDDVKTNKIEENGKSKEQTEAMEVIEDTPAITNGGQKEKNGEVKIETVVKEKTESNIEELPVCDVKPLVNEETVAKLEEDKKEQDKKEADAKVATPTLTDDNDQNKISTEQTVKVVTEIEDISEKKSIEDVGEIIEGLEPVIEEPDLDADMVDLQNVGEVLDKECDEILSKVQDVTNLDNISVKPLLTPVLEESMITENGDTNDIVDNILDTEMEMNEIQDANNKIIEETKEEIKIAASDKIEQEQKMEKSEEVKQAEENKTPKEPDTVENNESSVSKVNEVNNKVADDKPEEKSNSEENCKTEGKKEETVEETDVNEKIETETLPKDTTATVEDTNKQKEPIPEKKTDSKRDEPKVNGKTNNSEDNNTLNGNTCKEEELNSRLSGEEGKDKEKVNGSSELMNNGNDSAEVKSESDVSDIKVKSVPIEGAPIEQTTEA